VPLLLRATIEMSGSMTSPAPIATKGHSAAEPVD
jgi:hypothetical protein